jgi:hypothetical protein
MANTKQMAQDKLVAAILPTCYRKATPPHPIAAPHTMRTIEGVATQRFPGGDSQRGAQLDPDFGRIF